MVECVRNAGSCKETDMPKHSNAGQQSTDDLTHDTQEIVADGKRQEALLKEYSEVSSNFRMLTDIRFKLLAFLPIAAAVTTVLKQESPGAIMLALSLFGLVVTIGIVTYNARNDQLYDELLGRAAAIERSLGIPDGAYANRPKAWLRIRLFGVKWNVDHRAAIGTIYSASIALWLFGVVVYVLGVTVKNLPTWWVDLIAIAAAIIITYLGGRSIRRQREARSMDMQFLAASAVTKAVGRPVSQVARDPEVIEICAKLLDSTKDKVRARARFYATADPEWVRYYVPQDSQELSACHLIALLTDLSPLWIFDCYTNRRGLIPEA
jgi:hypothetical protein